MKPTTTRFSRISKLLVDRDEATVEDALMRRQQYVVTLLCGPDIAHSYTLQLAVLTAAVIANKCFPRAVRIALEERLTEAPLLVWPSLKCTFGQAFASFLGPEALIDHRRHELEGRVLLFGNADPEKDALRVTFDGWIAKVGPVNEVERLPEREYCSLSGILAASLAVSELFLSFAEISIEAARRTAGLSLWRPDLEISDPSALGVQVQFLPRELWVLGLGHLGNAFLWSLATLPYPHPRAVEIFLNDFDKIEPENVETGLIFKTQDTGCFKTRVCSQWLQDRGFQTRLIERRFDSNLRCRDDEPRLALCGFDTNPARRDLEKARFLRVIESGLGGTPNNFDTISIHTLPNPRTPEELWPDLAPKEETKRIEHQKRVARENTAYSHLADDDCGRFEFAGKSIAVPFVGATAACFVLAETIRLLHNGPAYTDVKFKMAVPSECVAQTTRNYSAEDFVGLTYCDLKIGGDANDD